jgi:hypothetical protein
VRCEIKGGVERQAFVRGRGVDAAESSRRQWNTEGLAARGTRRSDTAAMLVRPGRASNVALEYGGLQQLGRVDSNHQPPG